ncbi:hypothetical protein E2C01_070375 [Portunus trituberculatus]|uniref:Uncharacterized protein n=1 Tax=Portunus trituberculatus TaxID=210409 RepID=A0A5B7I589_PORTR|nr:hypothetical protein [Portunus trituberculatus]
MEMGRRKGRKAEGVWWWLRLGRRWWWWWKRRRVTVRNEDVAWRCGRRAWEQPCDSEVRNGVLGSSGEEDKWTHQERHCNHNTCSNQRQLVFPVGESGQVYEQQVHRHAI